MTKILLVNDEADIILTVQQLFQDGGFEVDSYEDPISALENFRSKFYDLIIIDNKMPQMDGFTFYRKIKALDNNVKVCFLTATDISKNCPEDIALLLPDSYMVRIPIDNQELLHRIRDILRS